MRKRQILGFICASVLTGATFLLLKHNNAEKYSDKWFASVSRDELEAEREKISTMWRSIGGDFYLAVKLESLLRLFDNEL